MRHFFSILSHVDADEATWWHDMEGIKPFRVQLSFKESRQDNSIRRGDILYLQISVWHSELWGLLEGIPKRIRGSLWAFTYHHYRDSIWSTIQFTFESR